AAVFLVDVVDRGDVRMVETGQRLRTPLEGLHAPLQDVAEGPLQELHRHHPLEEDVLGDVDAPHSPSGEELEELALSQDSSDFEGRRGFHSGNSHGGTREMRETTGRPWMGPSPRLLNVMAFP